MGSHFVSKTFTWWPFTMCNLYLDRFVCGLEEYDWVRQAKKENIPRWTKWNSRNWTYANHSGFETLHQGYAMEPFSIHSPGIEMHFESHTFCICSDCKSRSKQLYFYLFYLCATLLQQAWVRQRRYPVFTHVTVRCFSWESVDLLVPKKLGSTARFYKKSI